MNGRNFFLTAIAINISISHFTNAFSMNSVKSTSRMTTMYLSSNENDKKYYVTSRDQKWRKQFKKLSTYKEKHGHCLVPQVYSKDPSLGRWVHNERYKYKKRYPALENLTQEEDVIDIPDQRVKSLLSIGFDFYPSNRQNVTYENDSQASSFGEIPRRHHKIRYDQEKNWMCRYEELVQYKKDYGDCNVPYNYPENSALATWVVSQRVAYKKKISERMKSKTLVLTEKRIELLNKIDFIWDLRSFKQQPKEDDQEKEGKKCYTPWSDKFEELVQYKKEHGDCLVPQSHPTLGTWVKSQRRQHNLHKLEETKEKDDLLDEMRPRSRIKKDVWEERFQKLDSIGFVWHVYYNFKFDESHNNNGSGGSGGIGHQSLGNSYHDDTFMFRNRYEDDEKVFMYWKNRYRRMR